MSTFGVYMAKTQLPHLLDRVEQGEEVVITRHGKPIARLVPIEQPSEQTRIERLLKEIETTRCGFSLKGLNVHKLIEEGRRF